LDSKIKDCVFKKLTINGFSINEEGNRFIVTVRGMELTQPDTKMVLQEKDDGLYIVEAYGAFRGAGKKGLMQNHINVWIHQCKAELTSA